jgi:hypothetical protein
MQEACLRPMGKKLLVSLAMEGKFASDGLQAIDEGDDILMAMARELVTEKGIGESADAVWKQLQRQQAEVFGVRAVETTPSEIEAPPPERDVPEVIIPPVAPIPAVVTQLRMFGIHLKVCPGVKPRAGHRVPPRRQISWVVPYLRVRRGLTGDLIFQSIRLGEGFSRESPNSKKSPILMPINSDMISCRIYLASVSFAKQ